MSSMHVYAFLNVTRLVSTWPKFKHLTPRFKDLDVSTKV